MISPHLVSVDWVRFPVNNLKLHAIMPVAGPSVTYYPLRPLSRIAFLPGGGVVKPEPAVRIFRSFPLPYFIGSVGFSASSVRRLQSRPAYYYYIIIRLFSGYILSFRKQMLVSLGKFYFFLVRRGVFKGKHPAISRVKIIYFYSLRSPLPKLRSPAAPDL